MELLKNNSMQQSFFSGSLFGMEAKKLFANAVNKAMPTGSVVGTSDTQVLSNKTLTLPQINDTSSDHQYILAVSELEADRTVTMPLLAADDTFVFADFAQTLTNKTLTTPTIGDFTNSTHDHEDNAGGGQLTDAALSAAVGIAKGGTGQTTATLAFDALSPVTTEGDLIIGGTAGVNDRLAIGTSGYVLKSNGTTAAWAADTSGLTFTQDETATIALAVNTQYTSNYATTVTATLPETAAAGSIIEITAIGAGEVVIAQNALQVIHFGSTDSTVGVAGSFTSTATYDSIRLLCTVADTEFVVVHAIGEWTEA